MPRQPTLVQLNSDLLTLLDRRAAAIGCSRSELIRAAVSDYLGVEGTAVIDAQVVSGYELYPETEQELAWAESDLRESITQEPW